MTKTRTGDPFMAAGDYGRAMSQFSVNLLVKNVQASVKFYRDVVGVNVRLCRRRLRRAGAKRMDVHASRRSYLRSPSVLRTIAKSWIAWHSELRFLGADPDAIEQHAKIAGATILQSAKDFHHGWREIMLADPDGYIWTFGKPIPSFE